MAAQQTTCLPAAITFLKSKCTQPHCCLTQQTASCVLTHHRCTASPQNPDGVAIHVTHTTNPQAQRCQQMAEHLAHQNSVHVHVHVLLCCCRLHSRACRCCCLLLVWLHTLRLLCLAVLACNCLGLWQLPPGCIRPPAHQDRTTARASPVSQSADASFSQHKHNKKPKSLSTTLRLWQSP